MQRQYILVRKLLQNIREITQLAHGVKKTLYWRRCDVITSHRSHFDVVITSCACWGMDGTIRAQLVDPIQRQKDTYVFWPGSFLVVRCPFYRRYSINGPRIHFCCFFFFFFLSLTEKNQIWTTRKGFLPSVSILHTSAPSRRLNDKVKRSCTSHELVLT